MSQETKIKPILCKVKSSSDAKQVSNFIISQYNDKNRERDLLLRAIGAGALNQAIKAVIMANGIMAKWGTIATITPSFEDVASENKDKDVLTSIVMKLNFTRI